MTNAETILYYQREINKLKSQINLNNQQIKNNENDISELNSLKIKMKSVNSALDDASSKTVNSINSLPSLILNPFAILKLNFFEEFINVVKGTEFNNAKMSVDNSIAKIDKQISDFNQQVENFKSSNAKCNNKIQYFRRQISILKESIN